MSFDLKLGQLLADKTGDESFSGAVLVSRDGAPLFRRACGYANRAWRVSNQVDTRFRIASISKMFTAVAALQLVEGGRIGLHTSVAECLGLRETTIPREATIYHMLTMTSGIADWFDESGDWEKDWADLCRRYPIYLFRRNEDYLPLFVNEPPLFAVGEKYSYNGAGYILLGLVIEKVSGVPYFDYVRQHVLGPAGMGDSDFVSLDGVHDRVAEGYIRITDEENRTSGWVRNIYSTTPEAAADGGATSTIDDLSRFSQALRQGRLLSADLTTAMLTPQVSTQEERFKGYAWMYGYGCTIILDVDEQIVRWGHTGEEDGVSCRLYHYPVQNLEVIILGNQSWCAGDLGWKIHDLIMEINP